MGNRQPSIITPEYVVGENRIVMHISTAKGGLREIFLLPRSAPVYAACDAMRFDTIFPADEIFQKDMATMVVWKPRSRQNMLRHVRQGRVLGSREAAQLMSALREDGYVSAHVHSLLGERDVECVNQLRARRV